STCESADKHDDSPTTPSGPTRCAKPSTISSRNTTGERCSLRRHEPPSAGLQAKAFGHQKMALEPMLPRITMVWPAESRKGLNLVFARRANFCRPTCWRVLRESRTPFDSGHNDLANDSGQYVHGACYPLLLCDN